MTNFPILSLVAAIALAAAACSRESSPPAAEAGSASPAPASANPIIWADPLAGCGKTQVTHIHWSKEAVARGPVRIEIGEGDKPELFALPGVEGEKETGAWAAPGLTFILRGIADGKERARLVLTASQSCN